jgi:hypothetical protein
VPWDVISNLLGMTRDTARRKYAAPWCTAHSPGYDRISRRSRSHRRLAPRPRSAQRRAGTPQKPPLYRAPDHQKPPPNHRSCPLPPRVRMTWRAS